MAVTIDVGDPFDLHPVDKYDVGHRLALAARRLAYGEKVVGMGPLYKKMSVKGNKIILEFTNQGKKLMMGTSPYIPAGEPPHPKPTKLTGFGIAGADRKFVWADAVIEGNKVIVSSSEVAVPVAVRYGFSNSPRCNLYNEKGLPASPFRTDRKTNKWRAAQTGKRENSFRTASSGSLSILYRGIGRWKDMSESDNQYEARYFNRGFGILFLNNGI